MQHEPGNELVTPSRYAQLRQLNRSTISRQIQTGVVPTHGGLVNPGEADRCRTSRLDMRRRRPKVIQEEPCAAEILVAFEAGRLAAIDDLRRPEKVLTVAETALALGCNLQQAVKLATWYSVLLAIWSTTDDESLDVLAPQAEPDWQALGRRVGQKVTPARIETWLAPSGSAVEKWDESQPRESQTCG